MEETRFDLDEIRALVRLVTEADIAELSVESPTLKVSIKKAAALPTALPPTTGMHPTAAPGLSRPAPGPVDHQLPAAMRDRLKPITAPMVGTFYRAPSPDATPFVQEGDVVEVGQTVCIIEAMKLFNEIQSEMSGRVARILAENGQPVEYGQVLFLIEPFAG